MKKILVLFLMYVFFISSVQIMDSVLYADDDLKTNEKIEEDEKIEEGITGVLDSIWTKVRTLSPKKRRRAPVTSVAGIKGAERGSEELKPFWKGREKSILNIEIEKISNVEDIMEAGEYSKAITFLESFQEEFPKSSFIPSVVFLRGFCMLKLERKEEAKTILKSFMNNFPDHDFAADAKQILIVMKALD